MASVHTTGLPIDISGLCRACCRAPPSHNAVSVFRVHMSRKLMALAGVQVWPADGLPGRICHDCIVKLDISFQFKKQCEASDRRLRQHLASLQTAKEPMPESIMEASGLLETPNCEDMDPRPLAPVQGIKFLFVFCE